MNLIDLTGQKFERLTVIKRAENDKCGKVRWLCKCDCGNETIVYGSSLRGHRTVSCGCYNRDRCIKEHTTHGLRKTRLYSIWCNMKTRCTNPNDKRYETYGGRGIKVCQEWSDDFLNFYNWAMNSGYDDALSIERINVDGNYEPQNCTWIPMSEQTNNRTNSQYITHNGKTQTIADWQRETGLPYHVIYRQFKKLDDLLKTVIIED